MSSSKRKNNKVASFKLKGRSEWLGYNKDTVGLGFSKKKEYELHKNVSSIYLPSSLESYEAKARSFNYYKDVQSFSPNLRNRSKKLHDNYENVSDLRKRLKERDIEIKVLNDIIRRNSNNSRNAFVRNINDFNSQRLVINQSRSVKNNNEFRRSNYFQTNYQANLNINENIEKLYNKSLRQHRYTKSNPKIVMTNPITGVSNNLYRF